MANLKALLAKPAANPALAGFAAVALAFALYAMPEQLFADLVTASGVPALIPAAQPPFGETARFAAMGAAAAVCFLVLWLLLRACDRPRDLADEPEEELDWEAPRLRRGDVHPDAPPRRPIFADVELGEPEGNLGSFLVGEFAEPAALPEPKTDDLPSFLVVPRREPEAEPLDLGIWAEADDGSPSSPKEPHHEELTALEARGGQAESSAHEPSRDVAGLPTEGLLSRLVLPEDTGESVSSLLDRLDARLAACEWPIREAPLSEQSSEDVAEQLRSALEDLQGLSRRSA